MLWIFVGYHFKLIRQGYTTNESIKVQEKQYYLETSYRMYVQWLEKLHLDPDLAAPDHIVKAFKTPAKLSI
jgi:hypothetical protein